MAAPTFVQCRISLEKLLHLCGNLGVPIAHEKAAGPQRILTFAGIELDTKRMEARLPAHKIVKWKALVSSFLTRKKVQLEEPCSVVIPGRAFLRSLIDHTKGVRSAKHFIRLKTCVKGDLRLWNSFLDDFNSRSFFLVNGSFLYSIVVR